MKKYPLYQVDAFTKSVFSGNPAAVVPLNEWLDDKTLQNIARENNLSETAFIVDRGAHFDIRWFTPTDEVDLCGHATLASAYVAFNFLKPEAKEILFRSHLSGDLMVQNRGDNSFQMNFPVWEGKPLDVKPVAELLEIDPVAVFDASDLLIVLKSEKEVREFNPDPFKLSRLPGRGVIITAPGEKHDCVSRTFYPKIGVPEDPVTGSAHCAITPYWSRKLGKNTINAWQASERGGELQCTLLNDRVLLVGSCALYLQGEFYVEAS